MGARLLSVESFQEHKFISDYLFASKLTRQTYYYTSGYYFLGRLFWEAENRFHVGPSFWIGDKDPPREEIIYRVVYTYSGSGYRWTNITASIMASYICEIPRSQTQDLEIMNRDFDYGIGETDSRNMERGPQIVNQPESIIVFDGVETVDLECSASGNPYPKYSWYRGLNFKDASTVTSSLNNRYTLTGGKFTIEGPDSSEDLATYHCKAENDIGAVLSNQAKILFGYLGYISNVEPEPTYARVFKGTKIDCETPSYSPRVNYQWFKNAATNIFVQPGNGNMFVSYSGTLYVSEVQPTDSPKRYFCLITLVGTDDVKLGKANTLVRSNKGILLLLLDDTSSSDNDYGPILHTHVFPSPTLKGNTIRMECFAYGTHPLYYSWKREDGRPFVPGTTLSDLNRVLTIKNAPLEADGNYICTCRRDTGAHESKVITLSMETKPYFPYPIKNMFADPGMTIHWNCKAVARPSATYSWYKNGKLLADVQGHIEIRSNVLTIKGVIKARDEGMYQCAATNQHGTTFSTGQLRVLSFAPNFHRYPMPQSALAPLGGNITLECNIEAAPLPQVEWLKNGASLNLVPGDLNGRIGMNLRYGLILTNVEYSDRGFYTCKGTNSLGEAVNATQLNIMEGLVITRAPLDAFVEVNRTAFLFCQAAFGQTYDLTYVWTFNGRAIDYHLSPEYVNGKQNDLNGLYITNAQYKNSGKYECEARTTLQTVRVSAFLQVTGPPGAPAGVYVDKESVTTQSVRLIWSMTSEMSHGGAITSYDIEAETTYHPGVWNVVATDIPEYLAVNEATGQGKRADQRAVTVQNLIPNTSYRLRVRAVNNFGRGKDASKPSSIVKIEQTAPIIVPRNVGGGGGKVGTLTISWDILDPSEHCGPDLAYHVYWKKLDDATDYKKENATDKLALEEGKFVVTVGTENYYLQYRVKVGAYNKNGPGPNSTERIIYSAEGIPNIVPISDNPEQYNGTSVIVSWEPVPDTREAIKGRVAGYRVYYYPKLTDEDPFTKEPDAIEVGMMTKDVYGQKDHCQLIGLMSNTNYFSRVQVFNGAGFGPKGEWRLSETYNDPLRDHPTHVEVHQRDRHSIIVKWRGVLNYPGEESLQGYKLRVWKIQEDIRTAKDTEVGKVNEAVVNGLQEGIVYVIRILGFSLAGDGSLSEAVYFTVKGGDTRSLNIPVDPTTSEICFSGEHARTCGSDSVTAPTVYRTIIMLLALILLL
ncbi:contactin-like isoform X2 [Mercenaria mercenaria]|nr:contactin-like isoform X2 [Mercenaria mercenaria]